MPQRNPIKKYDVIHNPEFEKALRGFVPVFGSDADKRLSKKIGDFLSKLETVDNEVMRGLNREENRGMKLTPKMKELLNTERSLIEEITIRNNDF